MRENKARFIPEYPEFADLKKKIETYCLEHPKRIPVALLEILCLNSEMPSWREDEQPKNVSRVKH